MSSRFATYLLAPAHAAALQSLLDADPVHAASRDGRELVHALGAERAAGTGWGLAIVDGTTPIGVAALRGIDGAEAGDAQLWVAARHRRQGAGAFGLGKLLELAFQNLRLGRVRAAPPDAATRRLLDAAGFAPDATGTLAIGRAEWIARRDAPQLGRLHPALRGILDAELAAGNAVVETGGGWPDADSVFVRLRDPFRTRPDPLPEGVVYSEPNDPHWWKADYSSTAPRHVLAC